MASRSVSALLVSWCALILSGCLDQVRDRPEPTLLSPMGDAFPSASPTSLQSSTSGTAPQTTEGPSRPNATEPPLPTRTPSPLLDHPRLSQLSESGFVPMEIRLDPTASSEAAWPQVDFPNPFQLAATVAGTEITYIQATDQHHTNCAILFFDTTGPQSRLIAEVDPSRSVPGFIEYIEQWGFGTSPLVCYPPFGWTDMNHNGSPEILVGFTWANQFYGTNALILEVREGQIVNLTSDLPGYVCGPCFNPEETTIVLYDPQWAEHDCIHPPMLVPWLYEWQDGELVNGTTRDVMQETLAASEAYILEMMGQPLRYSAVEALTDLLVMYDRVGAREEGWQKYLDLAALANWPGTAPEFAAWLASDVAHFSREVATEAPLSPNDYCAYP